MKRCKHERTADCSKQAPYESVAVEYLLCGDCGEWLSLGPARNTPRPGPGWHEAAHAMRVEMRLAETLNAIGRLWEPGQGREDSIRVAVDDAIDDLEREPIMGRWVNV